MSEDIRKMIDKVKNFNQFVNEQKMNEISSNTFKSAINVSNERGTDKRTEKLGTLFFNEFIGLSLLNGKISNIKTQITKINNRQVVEVEIDFYNERVTADSAENQQPKKYIGYSISEDYWSVDEPIERKDARLLSKIAEKVNPNTKYKETGKYFQIKGW